MALPLYLAMTAAEMQANAVYPGNLAYMACHFSPYGTGLSNLPYELPDGAMLILNDLIPCVGHDHQLIANQLIHVIESFACSCILLDFQRPGCEKTAGLAKKLTESLPCSVGVSDLYAQGLDCPVFLSPAPLDVHLSNHLAPWKGREIWLDAALDGVALTLTKTGCVSVPLPYAHLSGDFSDEKLHCHYAVQTESEAAHFTLWRTWEDLQSLLTEAEAYFVTRAVGLWQELNRQESIIS